MIPTTLATPARRLWTRTRRALVRSAREHWWDELLACFVTAAVLWWLVSLVVG